ncbi:MAG: tyrosine-type recombinase/integrase, partial [Acidobacteriota bacterium]
YSTALRLSELAALDLTDLDLTAGTLIVRCGKGSRQRVVPLGDVAIAALLDYLQNARRYFHRRPGVEALFLAATHCGSTGNRLSKASIREIVRNASRAAGLDRPINPHQVRHACATHMLRAGADLRHIQQLLGHARIDTTEIYTQVDVSDLADVLARSHPRCKPQHS